MLRKTIFRKFHNIPPYKTPSLILREGVNLRGTTSVYRSGTALPRTTSNARSRAHPNRATAVHPTMLRAVHPACPRALAPSGRSLKPILCTGFFPSSPYKKYHITFPDTMSSMGFIFAEESCQSSSRPRMRVPTRTPHAFPFRMKNSYLDGDAGFSPGWRPMNLVAPQKVRMCVRFSFFAMSFSPS